jgi:dihydroorotate dehydrogenase electron transfer subunit
MKQGTALITRRRTLIPALWEIQVTAPDLAEIAGPGQFFLVAGPTCLRRPLFPARIAPEGLSFLVKAGPDPFVAWLASRAVGDSLDLIGPLGRGFAVPGSGERWLLLGETAVDVGPLLPLMERALAVGAEVTLVTGATHSVGVFPSRVLPAAVELQVATTDGSLGRRGHVSDLFPDLLPWADRAAAVGSRDLYRALHRDSQCLRPMGDSFAQVLLTDVPLACGVGACQSCAVEGGRGSRLACRDGPAFDLHHLEAELARSAQGQEPS